MALFGLWTGLSAFQDLPDILDHFRLAGDEVWAAVIFHVGDPGNNIGLFSAIARGALVAACGTAVTSRGPLTPLEATQVGLVWRLSKRVMAFRAGVAEEQFVDEDPWRQWRRSVEELQQHLRSTPKEVRTQRERAEDAVESLIDQCDESEFMPPDARDVNRWWQNYIAIMGARPEESEEPTSSQVAALARRVITNNQALYCDFAMWLPYGRRTSKTQKTRTYTPLGDGTFLYRDIPGPGSFQAWTCLWKVFKSAVLMLNIVNLAALELYFKHVEKLVIQYPSVGRLSIYTAEDTARAERLEKIFVDCWTLTEAEVVKCQKTGTRSTCGRACSGS